MSTPDVLITPVQPAGSPTIGFGLLGEAISGVYSSGGYSWTAIDRPLRKPFVEFNSIQLTELKLPLMLDCADVGGSIEAQCNAIHGWRYPTAGRREPPALRVVGPIDTAGIPEWVLIGLTWGNAQRRSDGVRVQQAVELQCLEASYLTRTFGSPAELAQQQIAGSNPAATAPPGSGGLPSLPADLLAQLANIPAGAWRDYIARIGDSLERIAAQQLGDHRWWPAIGQLNGIRDPRWVVPGRLVKLPW